MCPKIWLTNLKFSTVETADEKTISPHELSSHQHEWRWICPSWTESFYILVQDCFVLRVHHVKILLMGVLYPSTPTFSDGRHWVQVSKNHLSCIITLCNFFQVDTKRDDWGLKRWGVSRGYSDSKFKTQSNQTLVLKVIKEAISWKETVSNRPAGEIMDSIVWSL